MVDDLKNALQDIHGIGEVKAEEILAVVAAHGYDTSDEVRGYLENAHDHYEAGQPGHADKFVRRALDAL